MGILTRAAAVTWGMAQQRPVGSPEGYEIRSCRRGDRDGFLDLYESVWGRRKGREWWRWRFESAPFADDVEMIVAERDGDVVGAEPLLPFRLAVGESTVAARQPVDWIVHPDHRRRGVFSAMTERLFERYGERAAVWFNFPSDALRPGLERYDWTEVGTVPVQYRVQDPRAVLSGPKSTDSRAVSALCRVGAPLSNAVLRATDRAAPTPRGITVERTDGGDVDAIRAVYADDRPSVLHVPRGRPYLAWRFANPRWRTATYVARTDGDPAATVVVATESIDDSTVARVLDVQPMTTRADRAPAVAAALDALLADHRHADLVTAAGTPYPRVFARRGFLGDDRFPLQRFATQTVHVVRPVPRAHDTTVLGRDASRPENWQLALGDQDVA